MWQGAYHPMKVRFIPVTAEPAKRECGSCTLCCKVLRIKELDKPRGKWCTHAQKSRGCAIYADKPKSCADFECVWLCNNNNLPEEFRPDKIHGVLTATTDGNDLVLFEDAGWPGHARGALQSVFNRFLESGEHVVVVVTGEQRCVLANPKSGERISVEPINEDVTTITRVQETETNDHTTSHPGNPASSEGLVTPAETGKGS